MGKRQTIKTTIELEKELLYKAKMKALEQNKSLKDIVNDALAGSFARNDYLGSVTADTTVTDEQVSELIGIRPGKYGLKKKDISRVDIYADLDDTR